MFEKIVPVVLCGGGGTRLWPVSTPETPKQFLKLFGEYSLFQQTLMRLPLEVRGRAVVVTNQECLGHVVSQAQAIGLEDVTCLVEPVGRDSAAAVALATQFVLSAFGDDAVCFIMPSDHVISDVPAFHQALDHAQRAAQKGYMVTFGIHADRAATEFGYIQQDCPLPDELSGFKVARFVEKPDVETARRYLNEGGYFWNSGMFVFCAANFCDDARELMGDILSDVAAALEVADVRNGAHYLSQETFGTVRKISIDYAFFEKSSRVAVVPVRMGWSDMGNWASVYEQAVLSSDRSDHNVLSGDVRVVDVSGSYLLSHDVPLRVMGLQDIVAIADGSGILIINRKNAARVKELL